MSFEANYLHKHLPSGDGRTIQAFEGNNQRGGKTGSFDLVSDKDEAIKLSFKESGEIFPQTQEGETRVAGWFHCNLFFLVVIIVDNII